MNRKLPFIGRIFWKVLAAVVVFGVAAWVIVCTWGGYTMEPQDYVGSAISGVLLAYLVHLWLLPEPDEGEDTGE